MHLLQLICLLIGNSIWLYSLSLVYPNDFSIFSSDRHLSLTLTLSSRNTGRSRNFSISKRDFSPSLFIASPFLPIIIPFCLSLQLFRRLLHPFCSPVP